MYLSDIPKNLPGTLLHVDCSACEDLDYFTHKRDLYLKNFCKAINENKNEDAIKQKFDVLMRKHKQVLEMKKIVQITTIISK